MKKNIRISSIDFLKNILWINRFQNTQKCIIFLFLKIIIITSEMLIFRQIGVILDGIVAEKSSSVILSGMFYILIFVFSSVITTIIANHLLVDLKETPILNLEKSTINHLFDLGITFAEKNDNGYLFSIFHTAIPAIKTLFEKHFPGIIHNGVSIVISLVLFIKYSGAISIYILILLIPIIFIHRIYNNIISKMIILQIEKLQKFNKSIYALISSVKEIRAYQGESWQKEKVQQEYKEYKDIRLATIGERYKRGMFFRLNTGIGIVVYLGMAVHYLNSNQLAFSNLVTCFFYCTTLIYVFNGFVFNVTEIVPILQQVEGLKQIFAIHPSSQQGINQKNIVEKFSQISLKKVGFTYTDGTEVFKDVTLTIDKGDKILFVGKSGIGKTTLLKIIAGFYLINEGEIVWNQTPYKHIKFESMCDRIGYLFQDTYLFGGSIFENIKIGKVDAGEEEIFRAGKLACVNCFVEELPMKYQTVVGERGGFLSGGQKQRIAIARLILKNPDVIILDEATANLDEETQELIMDNLVNKIFPDKTIISVSHRMDTIEFYNKIFYFNNGKVMQISVQEYKDMVGI